MFDQAAFITLGFALVFLGFAITFLAGLLLFLESFRRRGKTRAGGLVMIGPIPIVFGTDKETVKVLLVLSVVLAVIVLIIMLLPYAFA